MGKKGVLLDNGKQARSSMDLYWKAAQNKSKLPPGPKKEVPEEDIESRAGSNQDKWKLHKEKMINKLYQKLQKKDKPDDQALKEKQKRQEEQFEKDTMQKEMNKNRPVSIPGFKNASQLKSKMMFEQVKAGKDDSNKLIPRNSTEELTQEDIIQILREKKAKKELARVQKQTVEANLRARQIQPDMMLDGMPEDREHVYEPEKKEEAEKKPQVEPEPEQYFKSELLQKIERGQALHKKQPVPGNEKKSVEAIEEQKIPQQFVSRFVPRALWNK